MADTENTTGEEKLIRVRGGDAIKLKPRIPNAYLSAEKRSDEIYFNTGNRTISFNEFISAMEEILERKIGEKRE